jgi:hypothetical protein
MLDTIASKITESTELSEAVVASLLRSTSLAEPGSPLVHIFDQSHHLDSL